MDRSLTLVFLVIFFLVTVGGVILRIDYFPLTWVPMYSLYTPKDTLRVTIGDQDRLAQGFEVTRLSGETDFIGAKELNIPKSRLRRIYYQRAFGGGPPKHNRERVNLNALNSWLYNQIGDDPRNIDWEPRVLESLNETFGLTSDDPEFIVKAVAVREKGIIDRDLLLSGELERMTVETETAVLEWRGE